MTYECAVKNLAAQPVVSIRTRTAVQDLPALLAQTYLTILQCLGQAGGEPAGPPFVVYYNLDMQDLDMEIGFPVQQPFSSLETVQNSEIPAGRYATTLHIGPYNQMDAAYGALNSWIQQNSFQATGAAYEFYLNDPREVDPKDLQTRILFPLV
jgi:effector-binding domain-containing protein